ncbi:MAG: hypothetical protein HQ492_03360, partial [Woeseiaceae bacterium]|nr:hypothetical protein [Woeseiaceae bacterium]
MFTNLSVEKGRSGVTGVMILVAIACMLFSAQSRAESGFFIGGSVGQANVELSDSDPVDPLAFDEDDLGYKLFGGYNWQFTILSLGVEAGYVNFGKPSADIPLVSCAINSLTIMIYLDACQNQVKYFQLVVPNAP